MRKTVLILSTSKALLALSVGLALPLFISGCASGIALGTSTGDQQALFQAESDFLGAATIAVTYENLPVCTSGGSPLCSDPSTVTKVTATVKATNTAIQSAQAIVQAHGTQAELDAAVTAAVGDVSALSTLVSTLKTS